MELLAPGGDVRSVRAAVLAGADAVYLGVGDFNARKRAVNISLNDLEELCLLAHEKDCRIYLTFNVLALEEEIPGLIDFLKLTVNAGIDAVIVQDYGLLNVIRNVLPDLEIHASTQMTTHNRGQIEFLSCRGVKQVNFSRELSLDEIGSLASDAHREGLKAEIFVHGAYCVSFSGQCYLSGALCDNSANRGACVQPCRREYRVEGGHNTGPIRPLNLKDNSLFSSAADLISAGADSLKIEGRIKGYEYVYTVVTAWKEMLKKIDKAGAPPDHDMRLNAVFNRSFSDNLLKGRLGKDSFTTNPGDQSFALLTTVEGFNPGKSEISFSDGSNFSAGQTVTIRTRTTKKQGQFVCTGTLTEKRGSRSFGFRIEHRLQGKILKGQQVWSQPRVFDFESLLPILDGMKAEKKKIPVRFRLEGRSGTPLVLTASSDDLTVTLKTDALLEQAEKQPTSDDAIRERLGKLGNTPYFMESCDLSGLQDHLFIPMKHLNELRQGAVSHLLPDQTHEDGGIELPRLDPGKDSCGRRLAAAVSREDDLAQIPEDCIRLFQLPSDAQGLAQAEALFEKHSDLIPWFPSILIGDQFEAALGFLNSRGQTQIVTDNTGIACSAQKMGIPWIAGPALNGSNGFALNLFRETGAAGAFISPELNTTQSLNLTVPEGLELWAPLAAPSLLMKSRHCLIRNCIDCGQPVMNHSCLEKCSKSAEITDSQGNRILAVKLRGEYNALYRNMMSTFPQNLKDPRVGVLLLDFRVSHRDLKPVTSLKEAVESAGECLKGERGSLDLLESHFRRVDRAERAGLDRFQN